MNLVCLVGRLGRDPELKALPSGHTVANFSIATDEPVKKPDGSWEKRAEWHHLTAWGKTAELAGKYLQKGSQVAVHGRLQTRTYEKDGVKHYSTEVVVDRLEFVGSKPASTSSPATRTYEEIAGDPSTDDIPF